MRYLLPVLLALAAEPSSAMYKCVGAGGSVAFQEQPCERQQVQTVIEPLINGRGSSPGATARPAASSSAGAGTDRPSLQEQAKTYETERLQREAAFALRDKIAQLDRYRQSCDAEQRTILANRARANNNLADAVYEQSIATEAAAAATRCDTRSR